MIWDEKHEMYVQGGASGAAIAALEGPGGNRLRQGALLPAGHHGEGLHAGFDSLPGRPAQAALHPQAGFPRQLSPGSGRRAQRARSCVCTPPAAPPASPRSCPTRPSDIDLWTEVMARTLSTAGVTKDDVVQNAYGYGLFTGGLGFHYGAERVGATVIPVSGGQTKRQIMLLQDLGSTVLCCTPSYALYLAEVAEEMGVDLRVHQTCASASSGPNRGRSEMRQELRGQDGPAGHRHLRPERGHRPRRQRRMRTPDRPAHLRGPLPAGDRRPARRASPCPTASAASW